MDAIRQKADKYKASNLPKGHEELFLSVEIIHHMIVLEPKVHKMTCNKTNINISMQ